MKVEQINAISLDVHMASIYAWTVVKEQFDQVAKKIKYLGGGSFGRVFEAELTNGETIVIKFLRAQNMLEKETYDLKLLAENCSVKIPKILFARKADNDILVDCYGMEKISGKNVLMTPAMFLKSKRKRLEFANKVVDALHEIHCCKNDKFGDTLFPDCKTWIECYKPFAKEILDRAEEMFLSKTLSKKVISVMRDAWEKFDAIFSEKVDDACLIHGDLNIANIMVNSDGNISGFIDPLNSMYADREYDLFQFDNIGGKRFYLRETYICKFGGSKYCDAKCAFYGLWNEVYCYIKSGVMVKFIMNPLVRNLRNKLKDVVAI